MSVRGCGWTGAWSGMLFRIRITGAEQNVPVREICGYVGIGTTSSVDIILTNNYDQ